MRVVGALKKAHQGAYPCFEPSEGARQARQDLPGPVMGCCQLRIVGAWKKAQQQRPALTMMPLDLSLQKARDKHGKTYLARPWDAVRCARCHAGRGVTSADRAACPFELSRAQGVGFTSEWAQQDLPSLSRTLSGVHSALAPVAGL